MCARGFIDKRQGRSTRCPNSTRCATARATSRTTRARHLDLYLEALRGRRSTARAGTCTGPRRGGRARASCSTSAASAAPAPVTKGKSMIAEEIGSTTSSRRTASRRSRPISANTSSSCAASMPSPHHRAGGAPQRTQVEADFRRVHTHLDRGATSPSRCSCCRGGARRAARGYFAADVGITGANFLIAETGTSIIVTNEGNGDLTQILPRVHIVVASIEKIVPTLEDAPDPAGAGALGDRAGDERLHHLLDRPAPARGSRRAGEYHVVLLDNGRSAMLGTSSRTCCAASAAAPA
jgi:L-lactate dehydrogenase complex protein LldF